MARRRPCCGDDERERDDPDLASYLQVEERELEARFYSAGLSAGTGTALNRAPRHATESTPSLLISSSPHPNERT